MARRPKAQPTADEFEPGLMEFIEIPREDASEEADTRWLIQHYAELVREYPMSWVAVQDQQVVGHGATPNSAMQTAIDALRARRLAAHGQADPPKGGKADENGPKAPGPDGNHHAGTGPVKRTPHLYFLERSADRFREH